MSKIALQREKLSINYLIYCKFQLLRLKASGVYESSILYSSYLKQILIDFY